MKRDIHVPPLKTQGIKTRLVERIIDHITFEIKGRWIEPFMESGVVGFSISDQEKQSSQTRTHI